MCSQISSATVNGRADAATIEARETYLVARNTITQTRKIVIAAIGTTPRRAPADVATPFPPRNPSQIGNE
jgi:hypothetical protein